MPAGPDTLRTEVVVLKRQLATIQRHLSQLVIREAQVGERRNPRLAITVSDPYSKTYPEITTEPDTYWINFIDGSFTRAQGQQGNTQRKRQKDGEEFALAQNTMGGTADAYVPEGSLIEVTAEVTPTGLKQWWFTRIDPEQDASDPSDPGDPLTLCLLGCGTWDEENCYNAPEYQITLPPGTTYTQLRIVRLMGCTNSPPSEPSWPSHPSLPSGPSWPSEPSSGNEAPGGGCAQCTEGTSPNYLTVDVYSIVDGQCNECRTLSYYTFILPAGTGAASCDFQSASFELCGETAYFYGTLYEFQGRVWLSISLIAGGGYSAWWIADIGAAPIDCSSLDVVLPFTLEHGAWCDASDSTVRVRGFQ